MKMAMARLRTWTPAQVAALVFGPVDRQRHRGLPRRAERRDSQFHLVIGAAGVMLCWRPRRARAYALIVGAIYLAAAIWSLFDPTTVLGVIHVDELGSADHAVEAMLLLSAWRASRPQQRLDGGAEGHPARG